MVEVSARAHATSRTYAVTDAGRDELRHWLIETEANRAQRNETAVRWFLLGLLEPEDRRAAVERELSGTIGYHAMLVASGEEMDALPAPHPFRPVVDLATRTTAVMVEWLTEQLEAVA